MTRILHVVTSVDPTLGGVAESIRSRGVQLTNMGHQVEVVSLDEPGSPALSNYPLHLHALGKGLTQWQYHPRLVSWLRKHAPGFDAVIVDGLWQYHGLATNRALRGTKVPYFVFPHGMLDPWFKKTYPLKHLKKSLFWPWAEYRVLRDAQAVLFTCEEERRCARESFRLYRAREAIVTLGTDVQLDQPDLLANSFLSSHPSLRGKDVLIFLGRLHPKKGCDLLIDALAAAGKKAPDLHVVMAGPGEPSYLEALKAQASRTGVSERLHWVGMLRGDAKWGALCASSAFILPSHQENFGVAVVEALACGKPVLISNKVNIWCEVAADSCGLVEPDTNEGTCRLLNRWIALKPQDRATLASNARSSYERRYTAAAAANALIQAIEQRRSA